MTFGEIQSIDGNTLLIVDANGAEKRVQVTDTTLIEKNASVEITDLATGETVIVSGSDNDDGSVTARSVQVAPAGRFMGGIPAPAVQDWQSCPGATTMAKIIRWIAVLALIAGLAAGGFWLYQSAAPPKHDGCARRHLHPGRGRAAGRPRRLHQRRGRAGGVQQNDAGLRPAERRTTLLSLEVAAGNQVEAGQTLAAIDPTPYSRPWTRRAATLQEAEQSLADLQTPATALASRPGRPGHRPGGAGAGSRPRMPWRA